jgi:hypothetical protein
MDENLKKQLLLMIIDKIFFGIAVAVISIGFSYYIQMKFSESERLKRVLQSASTLNSNLVVLLRKDITEAMENYINDVKSFEFIRKISQEDLDKLTKITEDIVNSINQVDMLYKGFSDNEAVESFRNQLIDLSLKFRINQKPNFAGIETELKKVKDAYIKSLIEIGKVSIKLAEKDYENVAEYLAKR